MSVSVTKINISNGKLCVCVCVCVSVCVFVCAYHLCKLNVPNLIVRVTNFKQFRH